MTVAVDYAALRSFLSSLGQIHICLIHASGGAVTAHDFGSDAERAATWIADHNAKGFNAYWTVNCVRPGLNTKPSKTDISAARFLHVDIDPPKSGGALNKATALVSLNAYEHGPPSFVIDSGNGLQAFWRLAPGCDLALVERANMALRDALGGDACQNIDRLMRVPGTVNWPSAKKVAAGRVPVLAKVVEHVA